MLKSALGLSLIELVVTLAVMALMTLFAIPGLASWTANSRVRSSAEALQNALRQAQAEAVQRSRPAVLALTDLQPALAATPRANAQNWYLQTLPLSGSHETTGTFLRGDTIASTLSVSVTGPALLCFNSIGRLVANSTTGLGASCSVPASFTKYDLTSTRADRPLRVEVYLGGRVRMCDPAKTLSTNNPDGCA